MSATPQWVKDLKPSSPQGSELLQTERQKSNICIEKLSNFLFTAQVLNRRRQILEVLRADKAFDKSQNYFNGRIDRFKIALARAKRLRQLEVDLKWTQDQLLDAYDLISEPGPYGLHASMFLVRI